MRTNARDLDNFDRHLWTTIGAALGILFTAFLGWLAALGWLIGWGLSGLVLFAFVTGRITLTFRTKDDRAQP